MIRKGLVMINIALIASMVLLIVCSWSQMPVRVPCHFNEYGGIDEYASRYSLWSKPILSGMVFVLMAKMEVWLPMGQDEDQQCIRKGLLIYFVFLSLLYTLYTFYILICSIHAWILFEHSSLYFLASVLIGTLLFYQVFSKRI